MNISKLKIGDVLFIYDNDTPVFGVVKPKSLNKNESEFGDGTVVYVEWDDGINSCEYTNSVRMIDYSDLECVLTTSSLWFGNIRDPDLEKKKLNFLLKLPL